MIYVRASTLDAIRAHQAQAIRPLREIVGRLVLRGGYVVRYEPLRNWAKGDRCFVINDRIEDHHIIVHSHPGPDGYDRPSKRDLSGAGRWWLERPYGIYVQRLDALLMFEISLDRKSWIEHPVTILEGS